MTRASRSLKPLWRLTVDLVRRALCTMVHARRLRVSRRKLATRRATRPLCMRRRDFHPLESEPAKALRRERRVAPSIPREEEMRKISHRVGLLERGDFRPPREGMRRDA